MAIVAVPRPSGMLRVIARVTGSQFRADPPAIDRDYDTIYDVARWLLWHTITMMSNVYIPCRFIFSYCHNNNIITVLQCLMFGTQQCRGLMMIFSSTTIHKNVHF